MVVVGTNIVLLLIELRMKFVPVRGLKASHSGISYWIPVGDNEV